MEPKLPVMGFVVENMLPTMFHYKVFGGELLGEHIGFVSQDRVVSYIYVEVNQNE